MLRMWVGQPCVSGSKYRGVIETSLNVTPGTLHLVSNYPRYADTSFNVPPDMLKGVYAETATPDWNKLTYDVKLAPTFTVLKARLNKSGYFF